MPWEIIGDTTCQTVNLMQVFPDTLKLVTNTLPQKDLIDSTIKNKPNPIFLNVG